MRISPERTCSRSLLPEGRSAENGRPSPAAGRARRDAEKKRATARMNASFSNVRKSGSVGSRLLAQLEEDAPGRGRMHERHEAAVRAREGLLVDQPHAGALQERERRADVRDLQADVVYAGPSLL